jgi:hypothetical protein
MFALASRPNGTQCATVMVVNDNGGTVIVIRPSFTATPEIGLEITTFGFSKLFAAFGSLPDICQAPVTCVGTVPCQMTSTSSA